MTATDSLKIFQNLVSQFGINDPHLISRHMKAISIANHSDYGQSMASQPSQPPMMGGQTPPMAQNSASSEPLGAGGLPVSPNGESGLNSPQMA